MGYVPNTDADRAAMLAAIGVKSAAELFEDIPAQLRRPPLSLPKPLSEPEVLRHMCQLAQRNVNVESFPSFLGAGAYYHFVPSVVGHVTSRSEFYTSYTPYQPEVSQGTLQTIYEYQSMVCELTGMDVANASMYDGASALAEAIIMACNITRRDRVVMAPGVHPEYQQVVSTYTPGLDIEIVGGGRLTEPGRPFAGTFDPKEARRLLNDNVACLVVQEPSFFGCLEPVDELSQLAHECGALLVLCCTEPISLGLLRPPGDYGADIVVGEGQSLGNPLSFGGPYLGLFACRERFVRQMPGRIVGAAVDHEGRRGYVLTLQAREQHIRREKASSNICTNEALNALAASVYLASLGKAGLRRVAEQCAQKAHYAAERIAGLPGFHLAFEAPFFDEFAVDCPVDPSIINERLLERGIIGGYPLKNHYASLSNAMLFCVTEANRREDVDALVSALEEIGRGRSV